MMDQHVAYIEKMVAQGGPVPAQYASFDRWLAVVADELRTGRMTEEDLKLLHQAFGRALSTETLQGFSLIKPHGYTGDYEIIDRMYTEYATNDPELRNWDLYFHAQSAPTAVRNRKAYFIQLLHSLSSLHGGKKPLPTVLNVASGPARDIFEFFSSNGQAPRLTFECVDSDGEAVNYAKSLCKPYLKWITFQEVNALRFTTNNRYSLIWSAGLFDYFGDKGFKFLLERLLGYLADDGELVIGNFSKNNPTRNYMEIIGDWYLYHRSEEELVKLARDCGVAAEDIRVGREPEGVNLFLHIKRGKAFLPMDS